MEAARRESSRAWQDSVAPGEGLAEDKEAVRQAIASAEAKGIDERPFIAEADELLTPERAVSGA